MFRILSIMLTSQVPKHFIVFIMQHILSSWWLPSFIITVITCYLSLLAHFTKSPVIRPLSTFKSEELKRLTVCLCIFQGKDGLGIFCHGSGFLFFLGWSAVKLAFFKMYSPRVFIIFRVFARLYNYHRYGIPKHSHTQPTPSTDSHLIIFCLYLS